MITDEEARLYEKLTGEDPNNVSIIRMESYLDGYKKGIEELEKIKEEIEKIAYGYDGLCHEIVDLVSIKEIFENYISELKGDNKE